MRSHEPIPILQVDAFTREPFAGNPAGVCLLERAADPVWMQRVAAEMNLAETAFVEPQEPGTNRYALRWFTPTVEVDLCGHATLAAAHVLWERGTARDDLPIRFDSRSGELVAAREGSLIGLDFPATPVEPCSAPAGLARALGAEQRYVGQSQFDYLVELDSEQTVRELAVDLAAVAALGLRGLIVTAAATTLDGIDFVSRFFAPAVGVDEDPVTGSAHCALGPYWAERLGRSRLSGYQVSRRGGCVQLVCSTDRVQLLGEAVTVFRGELLV